MATKLVKNVFRNAPMGYNKDDVNNYLSEAARSIEKERAAKAEEIQRLIAEKAALSAKLAQAGAGADDELSAEVMRLREEIETLRQENENLAQNNVGSATNAELISRALIAAEEEGERIRAAAKKEAAKVLGSIDAEIEKRNAILAEANERVAAFKEAISEAFEDFKELFADLGVPKTLETVTQKKSKKE